MSKVHNTPAFRAGGWVIVSGQTGRIGEKLVSDAFPEQFSQCLKNVRHVLEQESVPLTAVAKVNIYLRKMSDREVMNTIYSHFFGEHLPARTTVGVSELSRDALVEVEVWAFDGKH
ncbi:RidA family protein [Ottowia thiooxydans]|uniref:RidA family protein n=1 Tax=Ottowia thiooxydans TaxID=219182 RepID=UPI000416D6F4|nr:RidA family protein [Ottowia thiooxydans]